MVGGLQLSLSGVPRARGIARGMHRALLVAACLLLPVGGAAAQPADIERLAWLGGCWKLDDGEAGSVEQWLPLAGGTLLGVSRTVRQGRTAAFEFMQIAPLADGRLAFHAQPSGQPAATFPLASLDERQAVFENRQHDFPQRIVYAVDAAGTKLDARIEGQRFGGPHLVTFPMTRVSCDSMAAAPQAPRNALVHEGVVTGPVDEVWAAFTTPQGQRSWMVAHSEIDLRVGGLMRTHYDPQGTLGDPGTIENTILSFEPQRMFSIKVHKAPRTFPFPNAVRQMWSVIYFQPEGPAATRVRLVSMGFGDDDESKAMRAFFDRGNAYTLKKLQERFAGRP